MTQQHQDRRPREAGSIELTPEERSQRLYQNLLDADKPIRSFLIRFNRILKAKFGETDICTNSSCSGHVQPNGSSAYFPVTPELFAPGKYPKREMFPHLCLDASCETTSPKRRDEIEAFSSLILRNAVKQTNAALGPRSAKLIVSADPNPQEAYPLSSFVPQEIYVLVYRVSVTPKLAFEVIKLFWMNMEAELQKHDSLPHRTETTIKDFYHSDHPLLPGQIRPT